MNTKPTPPCLAAISDNFTIPRVLLPDVVAIAHLELSTQIPADEHLCWIKGAGRAPFLIKHEPSFADTINAGLETAEEAYRVDNFELYPWPERSPFSGYAVTIEPINGNPGRNLVSNWYCFKGSDRDAEGKPVEHWAIASARRRGSIIYGDCGGCPGCSPWQPPEPEPPKYPKWRGY